MKKITFNKLYIFSLKEQKAFFTCFQNGINIITSDKDNGNKKGKSVIMKSLYHILGADCFFEDKWELSTKTYILETSIDEEIFFFYRFNNLFKIFDDNFILKIIICTVHL